MPAEPIRDDQILVQYLLGWLPQDQSERLDELSVSDDDFAWRLRAAEYDLVDAYLRNELSGETLDRFRSIYLCSAHRREKVSFAEVLLALAAQDPQPSRRWFAVPLVIPRWALVSGVAAALVLAGVLIEENVGLRNRARQAEQAVLARQSRQEVASAQPLAALVLRPPLRSGGPVPEVSVPRGAGRVAFVLKLENGDFPAYVAALKDAGGSRSLWQSDELKPVSGFVSLSVPANLLQAGVYLLQLSPAGRNSEPLANYSFRVVSP